MSSVVKKQLGREGRALGRGTGGGWVVFASRGGGRAWSRVVGKQ